MVRTLFPIVEIEDIAWWLGKPSYFFPPSWWKDEWSQWVLALQQLLGKLLGHLLSEVFAIIMYMYVRYSDSCAISSECGYFLQFEKFPLGWVGWAEGQQKEDKSSLKDFPRLKNALIKVVWQWDSVWLREGTLKWSCPQVAPSIPPYWAAMGLEWAFQESSCLSHLCSLK